MQGHPGSKGSYSNGLANQQVMNYPGKVSYVSHSLIRSRYDFAIVPSSFKSSFLCRSMGDVEGEIEEEKLNQSEVLIVDLGFDS
jgi:hypothetical protein